MEKKKEYREEKLFSVEFLTVDWSTARNLRVQQRAVHCGAQEGKRSESIGTGEFSQTTAA